MDSKIFRKKINILIVADEIFPDTHGGVHTYVYEIAKGLAKCGHSVSILTKKINDSLPSEDRLNNIAVYRYKAKRYKLAILSQIANIIQVKKEISRLAGKNNFDIINIHSPHASLGINLSKAGKKIPKIYTFHALLAGEELYGASLNSYKWHNWRKYVKPVWFSMYLFLSRWLEKKALDSSDKIISLSEFTANCLMKTHNIMAIKIEKIAAGVDIENFKPSLDKVALRNMLGLPNSQNILFTVRRLVPRMGLDNLIMAMPDIVKKCPDTVLLIGGRGPMGGMLKSLRDELKLEKQILLLGSIDDEKLRLYYQASDLFILPSIALEGFGIVTLEALASGVPVLGTPVGGTVEILNRLYSELLFKDTSPKSMADSIIEYLTDDKKRTEIQAKCRQFVLENYSWDRFIQRTEQLFLEIVASKSR